MTTFETVLRNVAADLDSIPVPWALVGALAVSAHVEPRFTADIDLAVAVSGDPHAEAVIRELQSRGYRTAASVEQEATGRLATIRLETGTSDEAMIVDLLFASSGIETELVRDGVSFEVLPGLHVRVALRGDLIALKLLSRDDVRRPQDLVDLRGLVRSAAALDVKRARESIDLISQRGYSRGRDLGADLASLIEQSPY